MDDLTIEQLDIWEHIDGMLYHDRSVALRAERAPIALLWPRPEPDHSMCARLTMSGDGWWQLRHPNDTPVTSRDYKVHALVDTYGAIGVGLGLLGHDSIADVDEFVAALLDRWAEAHTTPRTAREKAVAVLTADGVVTAWAESYVGALIADLQGATSGGQRIGTSTMLTVSYAEADILGIDNHKVRVKRLWVDPDPIDPVQLILWASATGAVLAGAVLAGAVLAGAVLAGAVLAGAVLAGAVLARANLYGATCDTDTRLPDGWKVDGGLVVPS